MVVRKGWFIVAAMAVVALAMILVAGCTTTSTTKNTNASGITTLKAGELQIGSDTSFPPFETLEGDKVTGFDVDLMTAIGKKLGYKVVFVTANFDGLIPSLNAKKFDGVATAMTITADRQKEVAFSDPYIDSDQSLTVKKTSGIKSTADLKGKNVGAQTGTTGEKWATENLKNKGVVTDIKSFPTATEAFTALEAGQIDAIINDYPGSAYIVKDKPDLALVEKISTNEKYGFAFRKADTKLVAAVNKALKELKSSGQYDTIFEKWFGKKQ
jgi:polar amino acid transport system substrate-binding protein